MNLLYYLKYRGGAGDLIRDMHMRSKLRPLAAERQEPGKLAVRGSFKDLCDEIFSHIANPANVTVTISNVKTRPGDYHQFLVFVIENGKNS